MSDMPDSLRERLADLCHRQWAGWMRYLFGKCENEAGGVVSIPRWAVDRWMRQMETPYRELSDKERESDRAEADKFLEIIRADLVPGPCVWTAVQPKPPRDGEPDQYYWWLVEFEDGIDPVVVCVGAGGWVSVAGSNEPNDIHSMDGYWSSSPICPPVGMSAAR